LLEQSADLTSAAVPQRNHLGGEALHRRP
jgi:hypothetical protein